MVPNTHFILLAILVLLMLGFGFWLSRAGKPYNRALFGSGGLLSAGKLNLNLMLTIHLVASVVLVICFAVTFWLLAVQP